MTAKLRVDWLAVFMVAVFIFGIVFAICTQRMRHP